MKNSLTENNGVYRFDICSRNIFESILIELFLKIKIIQKKKILIPKGEKQININHDVSIIKLETIKQNNKYIKSLYFIPEIKKDLNSKNNQIYVNINLFFKKIYEEKFYLNRRRENTSFNFKNLIKKIKDLDKRISNLNKEQSNQNVTFENKEILNKIRKYVDVENETTEKLNYLNINKLSMLILTYKEHKRQIQKSVLSLSDFVVNEHDNTLLLYSAIYFKVGKKYKNQPNNINYGFVVYNKNKKYKLYQLLYRIIYFNNPIEKGYITSNGSFYNVEEALDLVDETKQTSKKIKDINNNIIK